MVCSWLREKTWFSTLKMCDSYTFLEYKFQDACLCRKCYLNAMDYGKKNPKPKVEKASPVTLFSLGLLSGVIYYFNIGRVMVCCFWTLLQFP